MEDSPAGAGERSDALSLCNVFPSLEGRINNHSDEAAEGSVPFPEPSFCGSCWWCHPRGVCQVQREAGEERHE